MTLLNRHEDLARWSWPRLVSELLANVSNIPPHAVAESNHGIHRENEAALSWKLAIAQEIICRELLDSMKDRPLFDSPARVREWLTLYFAGLGHEVFVVFYLDNQHRLIDAEELFRGTLTQASVYPREIVKRAMVKNAASLIIAHNHPSGASEASQADALLTKDIKNALAMIDVRLLDHFIIGGTTLVSLAEKGMI
ncbi:MAG: DNA repair protein RadC [Azoarcus sp.]|jgi:DNA repair protein RadC|nr:DNA repair protein RadC [Azoarcus sp.]